jgi:anti-sigma B factor antagonist
VGNSHRVETPALCTPTIRVRQREFTVTKIHCDNAHVPLSVRPEKRGDAFVVHVTGELDLASSPILDELLSETETIDGPLVLELTGVTFMGSSGLELLMKHSERCRAAGRTLLVVANSRAVLRPINLTGLTTAVTLVSTLTDALANT